MANDKRNNSGRLFKPKPGEIIVVCAWCGKEIGRRPGGGQTGISHGICPECFQKMREETSRDRGRGTYG